MSFKVLMVIKNWDYRFRREGGGRERELQLEQSETSLGSLREAMGSPCLQSLLGPSKPSTFSNASIVVLRRWLGVNFSSAPFSLVVLSILFLVAKIYLTAKPVFAETRSWAKWISQADFHLF